MKRLSVLDALFLYMETPETPMHVASVTIFKPSSPEDDLFARFREHMAARLDLLPSYRRRLEPTPLGIDHPAWVVDDKLDLDYHIRHAALPKPGGMDELRAADRATARRSARPFGPLWEYHFIEGLEDGAFAVYIKVHHCTMDGDRRHGDARRHLRFCARRGARERAAKVVPPDVEPSDFIELTSTAVGDFIRQGWRAVKSLPGVVRALTKVAPHFGRDARFLYSYVKDMPRTPFNRAISAHRVYATSSLPLPEVKALAKSRGVTINDVVLALCAGALRRYLVEHAALPEKPLTAGVPVSVRPFGNAQLNNQVVFTLSRLPTDVAEPLPRLAAAQAAGQEAKNLFADMRDLVTTDVSILGAPLVVMGLTRLWAGARAANYLWPFFNTVISNVPGPRQTMYCVGAPATHYFPVSIPYHGCALNITVQSYLDQLDFGLIACSETVPDAQRIADFIVEDFAAMRKADAEPEPARGDRDHRGRGEARSGRRAQADRVRRSESRTARADGRKGAARLTRNIEALSATTEALLRQLNAARAPAAAAAKAQGSRPKAKARKLASTPPAAKRALRKTPAPGEPAPPASPPPRGKRRPPSRAER